MAFPAYCLKNIDQDMVAEYMKRKMMLGFIFLSNLFSDCNSSNACFSMFNFFF
jgi:hypothetical protein